MGGPLDDDGTSCFSGHADSGAGIGPNPEFGISPGEKPDCMGDKEVFITCSGRRLDGPGLVVLDPLTLLLPVTE
jgi:hypothetical protein